MSVIVTVYGNYPCERTPIAFGPNIVFGAYLEVKCDHGSLTLNFELGKSLAFSLCLGGAG